MFLRVTSFLLRLGSLLLLAGLAAVAAEPKHTFAISAGPAEPALKQFSEQSGRQVIFPTDLVRGVRTAAARGELTAREALDLLLAGTGLIAVQDEASGAYAVRRAPEPEKNAPAKPADGAAGTAPTQGLVKLDSFSVNSTKIDGLNNKGLLQAGADAPLYHDVFTRAEIERLGVSSMEELFRFIPQTSSASTALQEPVGNTGTSGGLINRFATVGLRGFSSAQTVVLINGRALPRTGLFSGGGADISRIPIAAIERVEILPYSGSAIYGAGALGGAINIILRKEYAGRDLTTYVGTSTQGGGTEYRFTYLEGRSFNAGRTNLTITLSHQHREGLQAGDRDYLARALRRFGPDSTDRNPQGVRYFESIILPAFAANPGTILIQNAPTAAINDLGIPGAAGARYAALPAGLTAAQSATLTPGSFTATANQANLSPRYGRSWLYEPSDSYSFNAQVEHEILKDRLDAYGEFTLGYNRTDYAMPQSMAVTLSETDPLNPFRTGVTPGFAGRAVNIIFDTPDLPDPSVLSEYGTARAVTGLKGKIASSWEWSIDGALDYAHSTTSSDNPITNLTTLNSLTPFASPGPAAPLAVRREVYALLADHTRNPLSAADVDKYFRNIRYSSSLGLQREGNARVMGEVYDLPAGPLKTSLVGKYQHWEFDSGQKFYGSDAYAQLIDNAPFAQNESSGHATRKIWQGAVELSVPVISSRWRPLPVESLELQGSISTERDTTGGLDSSGVPFSNKQSADSRVIAAKLQITRDVALRASYSEGFYPPEWGDVSLPLTTFMLPGFFADPARGNTMQFTPTMTIQQGGNPGLRPETAESENYGVIFTPRFLPGLSLNVDYWKITKVDAIVSTSFTTIIANPAAYGFLITREAPTPAEAAMGWLGRITAVDARVINASQTSTDGFDTRASYTLKAGRAGDFTFSGSASFTNAFLLKTTETAPVINTAGGSGPVRWRGNGSVVWDRGPWSVTVTGRYVGHRATSTTAPSPSFPGASGIDGGRIPAYVRWSTQVSYELPARAGRGWRDWIYGTKWTLGVLNVLDEDPAFVADGSGFYDRTEDPRQRFVYVQIKKSL